MTQPDPDLASAATIQTYVGEMFDIFNPRLDQINMRDISHALSMTCRYGGHCRNFYSVAEHSVLMARYFEDQQKHDLARAALLHDASEAYMGDLVRPLKLTMPLYQSVEGNLQRLIFTRFGLPPDMPYEIKEADLRICNDERAMLLHARPWSTYIDSLPPLEVDIQCWFPLQAEENWIDSYWRLFG